MSDVLGTGVLPGMVSCLGVSLDTTVPGDLMDRIDRWLLFAMGLLFRVFAVLLLLAFIGSIVVLGYVLIESLVQRWP